MIASKSIKKPTKMKMGKASRVAHSVSFDLAFKKVLKQVHPGLSLSKAALAQLNSLANDTLERILQEANLLLRKDQKKQTLSAHEIQSAVKMVLRGEMAKHAAAQGVTAVTKYSASA